MDQMKYILINLELPVNGSVQLNITRNAGKLFFFTKEYYFNGDCLVIRLPDNVRSAGPLEIELFFKMHVHIFIHHSAQFLSPNSRTRAYGRLGQQTKYSVAHEVVTLLNVKKNCTDDPNFVYDHCMYEKMFDLMVDKVGCTVPWLHDKSRICADSNSAQKALKMYHENRRNQLNICLRSCIFTDVNLGPPVKESGNSGESKIVLYFRKDVKTVTEYLLYDEMSMFAEIGGFMGLFLGVSFLNVAYLFNKLLEYCR